MKFTSKVVSRIGYILAALACIFCFGLFTLSSTSASNYANAASSYTGSVISITNYHPTYTLNDVAEYTADGNTVKGVVLPIVTPTTATVKAKNSSGQNVDVFPDSQVTEDLHGAYLLVPSVYSGKYYITYSVVNGDVATSKRVVVEFTSATVAFANIAEENTKYVMPENVNPGQTIKFGYPSVIVDGDTENPISSSDATLGTLSVTVINSKGESATPTQKTETDGTKYLEYTVPTGDTATGSYKVKYEYTYKNTNQVIAQSSSFNVVTTSQFDPAKDVTLKINEWKNGSLEGLTLNVGVEATLPTPVVINSQKDTTVNTYNSVAVDYYNPSKLTPEPVADAQDISNYKFTPTKVGTYRFTYTCTDIFGNTITQTTQEVQASLSSKTLGLKLIDTTYDPETIDKEELYKNTTDAEYLIPTYIKQGTKLNIPAIIASSYGDYELNYTFTINSLAASDDYHTVATDYEFKEVGTYNINYQVSYKDNTSQRVNRSFEVTVLAELDKTDVTLSGALNGLPVEAKAGTTLNFTTTASDKFTSTAEAFSKYFGKEADTRLYKTVTAKLVSTDAVIDVKQNTDGTYSVVIPSDATAGDKIEVSLYLKDIFGNEITVSKEITVLNYNSDHTAPVFNTTEIDSKVDADFVKTRGEEISVLPISVVDADSQVTLDVLVKNGANTVLSKSIFGLKNSSDEYEAKVTNDQLKFTLVNSGIYTITYTATDSNNNQSIYTYQVKSESSSTPGFTLSGLNTSANMGENIELADVVKVTLDGEAKDYNTLLITDATINETNIVTNFISVYGEDNLKNTSIILVTGEFSAGNTPTSIKALGYVDLKVWVYGDNTDPAKRINVNAYQTASIVVTDTTKPQFTISGNGLSDRNIPLGTDGTAEIVVDWFATADDAALGYEGSGVKTLKITATYQNDSEELWSYSQSPDDDLDLNKLKFTATKDGKINVVYTVVDNANNEATATLVYNVGDCVAPIVSVGDQDLTKNIKIKSGEKGEFAIDLTKLKATDDGTEYGYDSASMNFTIKLTKDGTSVSATETTSTAMTWKELEAGNYVVTITATDKAGNASYAVTKTFKVEAEGSTKVTSTTVWGTILIILALVILAGVIFFFVRPTKGKIKVNTKKTEKAEEQPAKTEKTE